MKLSVVFGAKMEPFKGTFLIVIIGVFLEVTEAHWWMSMKECKIAMKGMDYQGNLSVSKSGKRCQRWDSQIPHKHNWNIPSTFPSGSLETASNFCRNPSHGPLGPWCYTTDPSARWEYCDVPFCGGSQDISTEARLVHDLLAKSSRLARPVKHINETTRVQLGLSLMSLDSIDENTHTMNTNLWARIGWKDIYLQWEPANYSGIDHTRVPIKKIWSPDLFVYNKRKNTETVETLAIVYYDGTVHYMPPMQVSSVCNLDMQYFPMDTQKCVIEIGSWTYNAEQIDLMFYDGLTKLDLADYKAGMQWALMDTQSNKKVYHYACCKEPYTHLEFSLTVQRRSNYYKLVYIGPAVLLAFLAPFIFLLPPADTQKVTLGIGLLICYTLFFNSVGVALPSVHSQTPLIDQFYMAQYTLVVLFIMLSTLVANVARRSIRVSHPPAILTKVLLSGLGRCLCVSTNMYTDLTSGENKDEMLERGELTTENVHTRDWLLIAVVIDRLFFLLSVIVTLVLTIIILNSYPRF